MTTGRNDPCPCGSGKKYKHCCLGLKAAPLPESPVFAAVPGLREALEGQQFASLDEANAFLQQFMGQVNNVPRDDFHGLSPDQMHGVLHRPFDTPDLAVFPEVLAQQPDAPIIRLFGMLVEAIGEDGLKPTAKGNLPRNLCRDVALAYWGEEKYRHQTRYGAINSEEDFYELNVVRITGEAAGLIRKYKGRFILGRDCRKLLASGGMAAVYPQLFRAFVEKFNWAYGDGYPELWIIQQAFLFTLYLLKCYGDDWRPLKFYNEQFMRAFPMALQEVPERPCLTREDNLGSCYAHRTFRHFADLFGLVELEFDDRPFSAMLRVRAAPLLGQVVRFKV